MWKATRSWLVYALSTAPIHSAASLTSRYVGYFSPPLNTRCSRKWAIPFSSGRSVRAPASKATRIVTARVPSTAIRYSGIPFASVERAIEDIRWTTVASTQVMVCGAAG